VEVTKPARLYEFGVITSTITAQTLALPTAGSCFQKSVGRPLRRTHPSQDAAPIIGMTLLEVMSMDGTPTSITSAASRPGKPCASTRGFSCRCRRDGAQPPHSRISRGEHADAVAVLVIGGDASSLLRRAADVLGTVKHWPKPGDLALQNCLLYRL